MQHPGARQMFEGYPEPVGEPPGGRRGRWRALLLLCLSLVLCGLGPEAPGGEIAARSAGQWKPAPPRPADLTRGTLLLASESAGFVGAAPLLHTAVEMDVTGMIVRVEVRQRFVNRSMEWVEGVYVFPLPDDAAVDHMHLRIGERRVVGEIQRREEARRTYTRARRQGKRTAMVEQERPNIFTTSVANIAPGDTVDVVIEYQQLARFEAGTFSLRFPLVVGPRYIPGSQRLLEQEMGPPGGHGWALNTARVPDASRITPPVAAPGDGVRNPVSMIVHLDAGLPLADVTSTHHRLRSEHREDGSRLLELADGPVPADRDFELRWRPRDGSEPGAALLQESADGDTYALLMVVPPASRGRGPLPREVVFVIDTSGSMAGASIRQARKALKLAIERLGPADRFNVIEFNSSTHALFRAAQPVTPHTRLLATEYVGALEAGGGTEMMPALSLALSGEADEARLRQVVFMTDGAVGNEAELFRVITERLGPARLFTVGIGSAPNAHFMRRAARFGRGAYTFVGRTERVEATMNALFTKLESPLLGDIRVTWPETAGEVRSQPAAVPDLYAGEPVLVVARMNGTPDGEVVVSGRRGEQLWRARLTVPPEGKARGIGVLWARRRIAHLMDSAHGGTPGEQVREQVTRIALAHHLVSRYTSLVAVDPEPARPSNEPLGSRAVPTNLPHGWDFRKVFGYLPQTATPAGWHLLTGGVLMLAGVVVWRIRCRGG